MITGWLRVEYRDAAGSYHNVTQEWLKEGFARGPQSPNTDASYAGAGANAVHPNAILIFQKRPNPLPPDYSSSYTYAGPYISTTPYVKNQVVTYNSAPTTSTPTYYVLHQHYFRQWQDTEHQRELLDPSYIRAMGVHQVRRG